MTKGGKPKDVFDVDHIEKIVQLMERHDLREVDLQQGDDKIRLSRGAAVPAASAAPIPAPPSGPPVAAAHSATAHAAPASADAADNMVTISAPMVGTFYVRANPDSEPFVKVGDPISEDTIVCVVEAMKVFNEIPAECKGKIVEILVDDQEPVDFGKPLFRVQTN
jgi:acetyl-CoA carboxylase biotin carboxyl carrier protein